MNNYTFKNILFVVPEKPFYKVLYAQTIIFATSWIETFLLSIHISG